MQITIVKNILFVALLGFAATAFGQLTNHSNFWNNASANNPAWMGFEGKVNVANLSTIEGESSPYVGNQLNASFALPKNLGYVGVSNRLNYFGYNGPISFFTHDTKLRYAYSIGFNNESRLNFGLEGGLSGRDIRLDEDQCQTCDLLIIHPSYVKPTFSAGVAYNLKDFKVGVALNRQMVRAPQSPNDFTDSYNFESQVAYNFQLNEKWTFRPMARYLNFGGFQSIGGLIKTEYNNKFWLTLSVDSDVQSGASIGMILHEKFSVGYGYNTYFTRLANSVHFDFHKVMLRYRLK